MYNFTPTRRSDTWATVAFGGHVLINVNVFQQLHRFKVQIQASGLNCTFFLLFPDPFNSALICPAEHMRDISVEYSFKQRPTPGWLGGRVQSVEMLSFQVPTDWASELMRGGGTQIHTCQIQFLNLPLCCKSAFKCLKM